MPTFVAYLMALLIPAADYIIASHLVPPGRDESLLSVVLIVLQLIAAAALGFVVSQRANALLSTALALIGVCIGVLVNADLDENIRNIDHNLYPIEMVVGVVLIMPGWLGGIAWARRKQKRPI
jgi:hypothetical protein